MPTSRICINSCQKLRFIYFLQANLFIYSKIFQLIPLSCVHYRGMPFRYIWRLIIIILKLRCFKFWNVWVQKVLSWSTWAYRDNVADSIISNNSSRASWIISSIFRIYQRWIVMSSWLLQYRLLPPLSY